MKISLLLITLFVIGYTLTIPCSACTTAIFSKELTKKNRPLLWRHIDSPSQHFHIKQVVKKPYSYLALFSKMNGKSLCWGGFNSSGFGIISTGVNPPFKDKDNAINLEEGNLMQTALQTCNSIAAFEKLLQKAIQDVKGSYFGLVEKSGKTLYLKVSKTRYSRLDPAKLKNISPAFLARNRQHKGATAPQEKAVNQEVNWQLQKDSINPSFLLNRLSKSVYNSFTDQNLYRIRSAANEEKYMHCQDCINQQYTAAAMVICGRTTKQAASLWVMLGPPLCSVPVVAFLQPKSSLPNCIRQSKNSTSGYNIAMQAHKKLFPLPYKLDNYLLVSRFFNNNKSGFYHKLQPLTNNLLFKARQIENELSTTLQPAKIISYYRKVERLVSEHYAEMVGDFVKQKD